MRNKIRRSPIYALVPIVVSVMVASWGVLGFPVFASARDLMPYIYPSLGLAMLYVSLNFLMTWRNGGDNFYRVISWIFAIQGINMLTLWGWAITGGYDDIFRSVVVGFRVMVFPFVIICAIISRRHLSVMAKARHDGGGIGGSKNK